jgi:hypothetical protein
VDDELVAALVKGGSGLETGDVGALRTRQPRSTVVRTVDKHARARSCLQTVSCIPFGDQPAAPKQPVTPFMPRTPFSSQLCAR